MTIKFVLFGRMGFCFVFGPLKKRKTKQKNCPSMRKKLRGKSLGFIFPKSEKMAKIRFIQLLSTTFLICERKNYKNARCQKCTLLRATVLAKK